MISKIKFRPQVFLTAFSITALISLLGLIILVKPQVLASKIGELWQNKQSFLSDRNIFAAKSSAELSTENSKLVIKFNIVSKDQEVAKQFLSNLGGDESILQGMKLELDDQSAERLRQVVPVELNLDIEPKKISFSNQRLPHLNRGESEKSFEFATESGRIKYKSSGGTSIDLEIEDPEPLLKYATESGQMSLSNKIDGLFPIMGKVGRIKLEVDGKRVGGEIELK